MQNSDHTISITGPKPLVMFADFHFIRIKRILSCQKETQQMFYVTAQPPLFKI